MIFSNKSQEKQTVSLIWVGAWVAFIYLTIPFARSIQKVVYEQANKSLFLWITFFAFALAAGWLIRALLRKQWSARPNQIISLTAIGGLISWVIWSLRVHPEEAFHLVQYGVLSLLLFRALSHRFRDPSIYAIVALIGTALGILDELIQWMVPQRVFDYRDIGINVLGCGLMQLALAIGIRPAYVRPPLSRAGIKLAGRTAILCAILLLFCLLRVDNPFAAHRPQEPAIPPQPLKIVFFSDTHARTEWETPKALSQAADAIHAQQADMVFCGGDMITEGFRCSESMALPRWAAYREMRRAIHPKPIEIIGNHDLVGIQPEDGSPPVDDPRAQVRSQLKLPQTYRSFDQHGYHFILLDSIAVTSEAFGYRGYIGPGQMYWLRRDLSLVSTSTPIVVVTHIPLLTDPSQLAIGSDRPPPSNLYITNNREVLAAFEGHHLLAVLQGHLHINQILQHDRTAFITGGSISGGWWRGSWKGTPPGFGVLQLYPDHVEWTYHPLDWTPRRPADE